MGLGLKTSLCILGFRASLVAGHNLLSATPTASLAVFYTGFSYSEEDKLGSIVCSNSSDVEI